MHRPRQPRWHNPYAGDNTVSTQAFSIWVTSAQDAAAGALQYTLCLSERRRRRHSYSMRPLWWSATLLFTLAVMGMCAAYAEAVASTASASSRVSDGPPAGSGRGFGRGPIGDYRCYQVCPPVVYPTGHDPYYDTPFFTYEKEMHGGPFGPGTLNPFNPNDPMNFAGHWPGVKQPVIPRSLPQAMPVNYYPGMGATTTFLQTSAYAKVRTDAKANANEEMRSQSKAWSSERIRLSSNLASTSRMRAGHSSRVHPKGVMCLHVCPKTKAARPDDEPMGGPFGPDPYYFRGKTMFNNKNGHSGFGSSASNFRNYQNEAYGGPFGPDPYYIYGQKSQGQGMYGFPTLGH